jgi:hypothetical protein
MLHVGPECNSSGAAVVASGVTSGHNDSLAYRLGICEWHAVNGAIKYAGDVCSRGQNVNAPLRPAGGLSHSGAECI